MPAARVLRNALPARLLFCAAFDVAARVMSAATGVTAQRRMPRAYAHAACAVQRTPRSATPARVPTRAAVRVFTLHDVMPRRERRYSAPRARLMPDPRGRASTQSRHKTDAR